MYQQLIMYGVWMYELLMYGYVHVRRMFCVYIYIVSVCMCMYVYMCVYMCVYVCVCVY
jgi:hypothetical protein